jgi:GT2 family glycosyltransferase
MQVGNYIRRYYGKDTRILYRKLKDNKGISANTNAALKMASGEYVLLSDHDDVLEPNALYEIVKALNKRPELDIVYTDEDKVSFDGKQYFDPHFKPDFNIGMLRSNNYICHITVIRKNIMKKIGGFRPEFDGAQDFDLILRCAEQTRQIGHIPKILYHWRCHPGSTAANPKSKMYAYDAGRKALEEHYKRCGIAATVENTQLLGYYRTRFIRKEDPMISIIIPNKDHIEDLQKCLNSIREVSTYTNYEILIVENNSEDPETFRYYEALQKEWKQVRVLYWKDIFNYASINNFGVEESKGEYLLFLNNDVEVITPDWLEEMLGFAMQKDIGAVGAKLYFPNYTIQHAGVVIGLGGVAGHIAVGMPGTDYGYHGRSVIAQDYSAVTAACMMVRKEVFLEVQGFDPAFQVAYNDIDLCMKIRSHGYRVAFTPFAELYHYESKSRGSEDSPEKKARFQREVALFEQKWPEILKHGDPCYNKNLTLTNVDCSLRESYDDYTKKRKHHKSR